MSIQVSAHLVIQKGKEEQFRTAAQKCRSLVAENEAKTNLLYDWFLQGEVCEVRETYTDSDAFLAHLDNVKGPLDELLRSATLVSLRIYGKPTARLMTVLQNLPAKVYSPL